MTRHTHIKLIQLRLLYNTKCCLKHAENRLPLAWYLKTRENNKRQEKFLPLTGPNVPLEVRTKRNYFAAVNL